MELAAIDEKQEVSLFERILFALFPFLIVAVLIFLLLTLFQPDFRNRVIEVGQSIPVVKNILPEPSDNTLSSDDKVRNEKLATKILELETEMSKLQGELNSALEITSNQEMTIKELQTQNESLLAESSTHKISDEDYTARISELANMFAKMMPSKAANIIQAMTVDEMALIFSEMRTNDRIKIMEKMIPSVAADVTLKLKDETVAKDLQIAALQSQIDELKANNAAEQVQVVSDTELAASFSGMSPAGAADMLHTMMTISSSKVLRILSVLDSQSRSSILEAMNEIDEDTAALLATRLMQ